MTNRDESKAVRPLTLAWVSRQLEVGERVVSTEAMHGGMTAEMQKVTVSARDGSTRELVLRSYVDPFYLVNADDWLSREAGALGSLSGTGVPAPALIATDSTAAHCEYPSLLMTHLTGRTVLDDAGLEARLPALASQLAAIHAVQPVELPAAYVTLTTADSVVIPEGANAAAWDAAIAVIRRPAPAYEGRFLHRDFQPGNVLFDVTASAPSSARISGVVDWATTSWGPADLDVAHCAINVALLHGAQWGLRFADAYVSAGGVLGRTASERLYWQVRDALASSEEVKVAAQLWREAGRTDLTTPTVEARLDAYVSSLMNMLS